jgi:SET domain-containing protein
MTICSLPLWVTKSVSCECCIQITHANLGLRREITFVAMRDIQAGEELTHDWAVSDHDDY